jgi:16S rRNA (cytosine967-C5)-methyltransferase
MQDVSELAAIQKRILGHAAPSVKPGGKLFYAVCTLTRSETTDVAADFNARFPDFEPLVQADFNGTKFIWPHDLGGNGMFIAGWRRKAA